MTSRSRRKRPTTPPSTPGSIRSDARRLFARTAACCAAAVAFGSALAEEPPRIDMSSESRGAAMLDALRNRDPQAHWDAAGAALPPDTLPRSAETVAAPSLTDPDFSDAAVGDPDFADAASSGLPTTPAVMHGAPAPIRFAQRDATPYEPVPEGDTPGIAPLPETDGEGGAIKPVARTPDQLRKIGEILPYHDYEPDPSVNDPCLNLCPRPDGLPCKEYGPSEVVPPCPEELGLGNQPFVPRSMPPSVFAWKASNVCHNPLYFEDPQLERYGHTYGCVQPLVSLGRFGVQVVGLPYQMALDPPCKAVYPLGYYRPGEPAPKLHKQVPFNARAAALAAVFYTGVGVVLP